MQAHPCNFLEYFLIYSAKIFKLVKDNFKDYFGYIVYKIIRKVKVSYEI